MNRLEGTAAATAAILGAAYLVRQYGRPGQARRRRQALQHLGAIAAAALAEATDAEPILYAIADGLYPFEAERHDRRRG